MNTDNWANYLNAKNAFVFGLDNVLYPVKDYDLQVYYLFSALMGHLEAIEEKRILDFMQLQYAQEGAEAIFEKTAAAFSLDAKYKENFDRLYQTARLPLKLLLYEQVLRFLQALVTERKPIFLFVPGLPALQLNKIKQLEWHGLESYLKVYFAEELASLSEVAPLEQLMLENDLAPQDVAYVGASPAEQQMAQRSGLSFLPVYQLL